MIGLRLFEIGMGGGGFCCCSPVAIYCPISEEGRNWLPPPSTPVVDRRLLDRKQHLEILATPKCFHWVPVKITCPGEKGCRNKIIDAGILEQFILQLKRLVPPNVFEKLKATLIKNADTSPMPQKNTESEKMDKFKCLGEKVGNKRLQEVLAEALDCLKSSPISPGTKEMKRLRMRLTFVILYHFCQVTGEWDAFNRPHKKIHCLMIYLADQLAAWLTVLAVNMVKLEHKKGLEGLMQVGGKTKLDNEEVDLELVKLATLSSLEPKEERVDLERELLRESSYMTSTGSEEEEEEVDFSPERPSTPTSKKEETETKDEENKRESEVEIEEVKEKYEEETDEEKEHDEEKDEEKLDEEKSDEEETDNEKIDEGKYEKEYDKGKVLEKDKEGELEEEEIMRREKSTIQLVEPSAIGKEDEQKAEGMMVAGKEKSDEGKKATGDKEALKRKGEIFKVKRLGGRIGQQSYEIKRGIGEEQVKEVIERGRKKEGGGVNLKEAPNYGRPFHRDWATFELEAGAFVEGWARWITSVAREAAMEGGGRASTGGRSWVSFLEKVKGDSDGWVKRGAAMEMEVNNWGKKIKFGKRI